MRGIDRRTYVKAIAAGSTIGMAGCVANDGSSGGDDGKSRPIKIGVNTVLSGPFSPYGSPVNKGIKTAVQEINDNGGINGREIELVVKDNEADPNKAVTLAREQVEQENVVAIGGGAGSSVGQALSEWGEREGVIILDNAFLPALTGENCRRHYFSFSTDTVTIQQMTAAQVEKNVEGTRIAGVAPDYSFGRSSWNAFKDAMQERRDVEIVSEQFPEFLSGDFQSEIQALLDAKPDIVHSSLFSGDMISFINQANEFDFFEQIGTYVSSSTTYLGWATELGSSMPEDAYVSCWYYFPYPDRQINHDFVEKHREVHGSSPQDSAAFGYAQIQFLAKAIREAGSTNTDDVISALESIEVDLPNTLEGQPQTFRPNHRVRNQALSFGWTTESDKYDFYELTDHEMVVADDKFLSEDTGCSL